MRNKSKSTRLKEIVTVLMKYDVVKNFSQQKNPSQVRAAFESLGATFIKLGQMLSVRSDLLSKDYINELKKLQDHTKPDSFSIVKTTMERELDLPVSAIFSEIVESPLASASIGQVHRGKLLNGDEVVIKVQHPQIAEDITLDLSLFEKALPLIQYIPESNVVDLKSVLKEVRRSLTDELNFLKELEYGTDFYQKNQLWQEILVPKMYPAYTTEKVLVMEYMSGESLKKILEQDDITLVDDTLTYRDLKRQISQVLVGNFMKQVFEDGFFHADPHPGNLLIQRVTTAENQESSSANQKNYQGKFLNWSYQYQNQSNQKLEDFRLVYLDFGMMGKINQQTKHKLMQALFGLYTKDTDSVAQAVLSLSTQEGPIEQSEFKEELRIFLEAYYDRPLKEWDLQKAFFQMITICHKNNLQIDQSVTMLIKALSTLEGVVKALDPELSLMEVAVPYVQKHYINSLNLEDILRQTGVDWYESAKALPKLSKGTLQALNRIAKGNLSLEIRHQNQLLQAFKKMVNRLVVGIILAATIIGSSILVQATASSNNLLITRLGLFGYGVALVAILFLLGQALWQYFKEK